MKLEQNCVTSGCFRNLAAMVYDQTEDTVYCARLYKKAEECSNFYDDYLLLGDGIHQHVGDQEWLRKIYSKMLKRWDDLAHVTKVVDRILLQINDGREWVEEVYLDQEGRCEQRGDFVRLAVSVLGRLQDDDWVRRLFREAEGLCRSRAEYTVLAWSVYENIGDTGWAESLYRKAFDLCRDHLQFDQLIRSITTDPAKKTELLRLFHEKAEKKFTHPNDLLHLAESISTNLRDSNWCRRVYRLADKASDVFELFPAQSVIHWNMMTKAKKQQ